MLATAVNGAFLQRCKHSSMVSTIIFLLSTSAMYPKNRAKALRIGDVARNKPTDQGPNPWSNCPSSNAVDGDHSISLYYCTHTATDGDPKWWMVDLQDNHWIRSVSVLNRGDCCAERLQNFTVDMFLEDPRTMPGFSNTMGKICAHRTAAIGSGSWYELYCEPEPVIGRFVRVIKWGFGALTLCEVRNGDTENPYMYIYIYIIYIYIYICVCVCVYYKLRLLCGMFSANRINRIEPLLSQAHNFQVIK